MPRTKAAEIRFDLEVQRGSGTERVPRGAEPARWIAAALQAAGFRGTGRAITLRYVGRAEGRRLNQDYRHKRGPTNVLAFAVPADAGRRVRSSPSEALAPLGDIVICLPVVYSEAREQRKRAVAHLAHLTVHGTLHLVGYTHDGAADARRMERLETRVLTGLGFPDPYGDGPKRATA